jgi:hypothetical protein
MDTATRTTSAIPLQGQPENFFIVDLSSAGLWQYGKKSVVPEFFKIEIT